MQEVREKLASRGRFLNHACLEHTRPQPGILVRDCNYDDDDSIRSSCYNRRFQDIPKCRLLRVAGDTDPTPPSEASVRVWNNLDCAVKVNVSYGDLLRHST